MEVIRISVPDEPLVLVPIGDIQYTGDPTQCDLTRLREAIEFGLAYPGGRFIGTGDYIDFASPSNRQRLLMAALYDTATDVIDRAATAIVDELLKVLAPTKGKWLGMVHGHHYHRLSNGRTTDQYLAEQLEAPYLGTSAFIDVLTPTAREPLRIFVHHYWAAGRTPGAHLHEAHRRLATHRAHVLALGHCHRLGVEATVELSTAVDDNGSPRLVAQPRAILFAGSYTRHWAQGSQFGGAPQGTYAEQKGLPPAVLGAPYLMCRPQNVGNHTIWRFRAVIDW
jgi:hypothetical protein